MSMFRASLGATGEKKGDLPTGAVGTTFLSFLIMVKLPPL